MVESGGLKLKKVFDELKIPYTESSCDANLGGMKVDCIITIPDRISFYFYKGELMWPIKTP
jgi:hypothetical protein